MTVIENGKPVRRKSRSLSQASGEHRALPQPRCISSIEEECDRIFELSSNGKYRCLSGEQELPGTKKRPPGFSTMPPLLQQCAVVCAVHPQEPTILQTKQTKQRRTDASCQKEHGLHPEAAAGLFIIRSAGTQNPPFTVARSACTPLPCARRIRESIRQLPCFLCCFVARGNIVSIPPNELWSRSSKARLHQWQRICLPGFYPQW